MSLFFKVIWISWDALWKLIYLISLIKTSFTVTQANAKSALLLYFSFVSKILGFYLKLTHLDPIFHLYFSWICLKSLCCLMFSGGIEVEQVKQLSKYSLLYFRKLGYSLLKPWMPNVLLIWKKKHLELLLYLYV